MSKATINLKNGTTVVIEGDREDVAKILADFERTRSVQETKKQIIVDKKKNKDFKKRVGASDLIVQLKEEKFFDKPRTLSEVVQVLEDRGYMYPATTLSAVMLGFVQKKILGRKKVEGRWVYGK